VRLQIAFVVLMALNVAVLFFLFRSPSGSAESRRNQLETLETQHAQLQGRVLQLRTLRGKVLMATQSEQTFAKDNFLPRGTAFARMIENLSDLASHNQLRSSDISYQTNEGENQLGWVYVEVTLAVEGDYPHLVRFINELEQSQLFWILKGLDVSGKTGTGL